MRRYLARSSVAAAGCPSLLEKLVEDNPAESRRELDYEVTHARVHGNDGVIFLRRRGSVYYFTMIREGRRWKAVSISFGTPLNPT
jgi:hypothetical protein